MGDKVGKEQQKNEDEEFGLGIPPFLGSSAQLRGSHKEADLAGEAWYLPIFTKALGHILPLSQEQSRILEEKKAKSRSREHYQALQSPSALTQALPPPWKGTYCQMLHIPNLEPIHTSLQPKTQSILQGRGQKNRGKVSIL